MGTCVRWNKDQDDISSSPFFPQSPLADLPHGCHYPPLTVSLQDCELLLLSRLGWDVYLDLEEEDAEDQTSARIQLDNLNFSETSR